MCRALIWGIDLYGNWPFFKVHFLCFISNAVLDRPVDNSQNFDGVAYIA